MDIDIDLFNQSFVPNEWSGICNSAQMRARTVGGICLQPFADLIAEETKTFVDQSPPQNLEQLQALQTQNIQLGTKIQSISNASTIATMHSGVVDAIYEATKQFCDDNPISKNCGPASQSHSSLIQGLGYSETMRGMKGGCAV